MLVAVGLQEAEGCWGCQSWAGVWCQRCSRAALRQPSSARGGEAPCVLPACPCPCGPRVSVGTPWAPAPGTGRAGTGWGTAACGSRPAEERLRQSCEGRARRAGHQEPPGHTQHPPRLCAPAQHTQQVLESTRSRECPPRPCQRLRCRCSPRRALPVPWKVSLQGRACPTQGLPCTPGANMCHMCFLL